MNGQLRTLATVGVLAAGFAAATAPVAAADNWPPAYLACSYEVDHQLHQVSGECSGHAPFGDAKGSFHGSLRPNCSAKGEFELDSTLGSLDGSFRGVGFDGGKARGTFTVTLSAAKVSGSFVARVG